MLLRANSVYFFRRAKRLANVGLSEAGGGDAESNTVEIGCREKSVIVTVLQKNYHSISNV